MMENKILYYAVFLSLLSYQPVVSAGQVYFDISHDRSVNIDVESKKTKLDVIGDQVTINKKGRLWLSGNEDGNGYQEILCQSRTDEPITLKLDSDTKPYIAIANRPECKAWVNNLLVCPIGDTEKGLFCKLSNKTKSVASYAKAKRTASVSVRSVSLLQEMPEPGTLDYGSYLKEVIDNYSTGVELCSIMHEQNGPVEISWVIYDGGNTDDIKINSQATFSADIATAECIVDQIDFWRFPEWKKNYRVSYRFQ